MILEINNIYCFLGKIENINKGDSWANITVILEDGNKQNIKMEPTIIDNYEMNLVYYFETICKEREGKPYLWLISSKTLYEYEDNPSVLAVLMEKFYDYAPKSKNEMQSIIESYLAQIKNDNLKKIMNHIYQHHIDEFYVYPAATKFHHAYVGGLAYHTSTMLKMMDSFIDLYSYLNKDLLISGIILHDMGKIYELSGAIGASYTTKGQLIGHLVLEANEISLAAKELDLLDSEEVVLLSHLVISSHGEPSFGAAKRPMIPEALLIWYFDTIDSKMTVIGEEFKNIDDNSFTEPISVLDRRKMFKHKI